MHVTGPRALRSSPAAALAARLAPATRRSFHQTLRLRKDPTADGSPSPEGGKPPSKSEAEQHDKTKKQDGIESTTRRVRSSAFASGRTRTVRSKVSDDLPPVPLPKRFLESNILGHDPSKRLQVIAEDPIFYRGHVGLQWRGWLWQDLMVVLDTAAWNEKELQRALAEVREGNTEYALRRSLVLGDTAQWLNAMLNDGWDPIRGQGGGETLSDAFLEGNGNSIVVSTILAPTRKADPSKEKGEMSTITRDDSFLRRNIDNHIRQISVPENPQDEMKRAKDHQWLTNNLEYHGSRIFNSRMFAELSTSIRAEIKLTPEASAERRELRRPVIVVNVPNYTGRYASRRLLERMAVHLQTDLLRIDAQDLAAIVGGYLGQDTAYSKGSISMLAYRTAEMNGRLKKGVEPSDSGDSDMSGDIEAAWANIHPHGSGSSFKSPMDEELHKIKEGAKDYLLPSVDRWENLKITAALEQMVQAALEKSHGNARALLIQVDNFVELNMTLEGALLLGRLRSLVDSLWQSGKKIVLVGTSANDDPSEQYTTTLAAISSEESLTSFPIQVHKIPEGESKKAKRRQRDYLYENLQNVHAMSKALGGGRSDSEASVFSHLMTHSGMAPWLLDTLDGGVHFKREWAERSSLILAPHVMDATMPCADVHHVARLVHGLDFPHDADPLQVQCSFIDILQSRNITTGPQLYLEDEHDRTAREPVATASGKHKTEPEVITSGGKYNDFEKKLLTGLVDVKEIKTTFADVHAPQETISALKLLTSLSLMRPEAFTYGILANDRIPGCLLYGPPGTGKTLLAKAVAKESGANMLEVSGASINDMYVGQSEKNVHALFSLAKKLSPLVIFIDEADALFAARGQSKSRPAHRETINQFLREWDGMSDTKAFIMVATNRPFDLDDAVLRRLPRKILVDLPLQVDRAAILRILLKGEQLDDSVSIDGISRSTVLYSGSDLKNLCVAAAMSAVQEELEDATKHDGPEPYVYPERRTLRKHHFDKAAKEIAASISEDMDSLKSIRKFDQKYGDQRSKQKKPRGMGFGVLPGSEDAEDARVRQPLPA